MSEERNDIMEVVDGEINNKVFFNSAGDLVTLDELAIPNFSDCNKCAIRRTCPVFEEGSHCRIEEAMVHDAVRNITLEHDKDVTTTFKLTLYDFLNQLVLSHRIQRMGSQIDYRRLVHDEKMLDLLDKYVNMSSKVSRRYMEGLKELSVTPRERAKEKRGNKSSGSIILAQHMAKAIEEEKKEEKREALEDANDTDR